MNNLIQKILSALKNVLIPKIDYLKEYASNIDIGNSILLPSFALDLRNLKPNKIFLKIGNDCMIDSQFIFETQEGDVSIGDRVYLGGSTVICRTKIEFGNDIFVAWSCYFYDHDSHSLDYRERHNDMRRQLADYRSGQSMIASKDWSVVNSKPIIIKDNVWIGMHSTILKGVTIGEGAIVGAGSVVTKDVEPWTVVAGNPARLVKRLPPELRK